MIVKKLTEAKKAKYTEADFAWDEKAMIAEYKAAVLDYMNGASMDDALKTIKAMFKSVGDTIVTGKGRVRESKTTKVTKSELKEIIRGALREELSRRNLRESNNTGSIVYLGKTPIDFSTVTSLSQLDKVLATYYFDSNNYITRGEYVKFVYELLENPSIPNWAKELFEDSISIDSIMMAGGDERDDIVEACYQALRDCGYSENECTEDDILSYVSTKDIYGFYIKNNALYLYISVPECELDLDFVRDYLGLEFR